MELDSDDEAPPMLVGSGGESADMKSLETTLDGVKLVKVPITIVTGEFLPLYKKGASHFYKVSVSI
jgi:hypothetical protein